MITPKRIAETMILVMICVPALLIAFYCVATRKPSGLIHVQAINGTATIKYDSHGVPTVSGTTDDAVFFGAGFAHAADRLWDMHLKRLFIAGRISEIKGRAAVDVDIFMRSLSIQHAARLWEAQLVPRERRMIEAYAAGVNAYVKQVGMLQFEFLLSGSRFEPWTVLDTLAMAKLMLFQLSMSWQLKAFRSGVAELYGVDLMKEIYPVTPEYQFISNIITVISDEDLKLNGLHIPKGFDTTLGTKNLQRRAPEGPKRLSKNFTSETGMTPDFTEGLAGMSNSWAIHGNYTKSGKPLLGNDPHLAHKIPGIWYLLTLKFPNGVTATGFSISGVPGVLIGRNNYVAWGYTASALENIDMYWLDIDEKHQTYYYNKTWVPLKLRRETIKVKGGADVTVDLYATHHGPVILRTPVASASIFLFGTSAFMANPYALSWNGFGPHDRSVTAVYDMMMARNTREFLAAVDKHDTIPAAIIFATADGDIGLKTSSKIPLRKHYEDAIFVRNGSLPENDVKEYIPVSEMPYVVNPRSGYVVGCNQQVVSSAYKHTIGVGMSSTGRSHRAVEMIEQVIKRHGKFDLEFVKAMQLDLVDSFAREIAKMLVPFAERHAGKYYTQDDKDGRTFWHMLDIVKQWDFKDTADSKGALVFNMWMEELTDGLLTEQIENKSHRKSIAGASTSVHFAGRLLRFWLNGTSLEHKYCLNAETRKRPMPCAYNAVSALVKAHRKILAEFGANEDNWRWGYKNVIRTKSDTFSGTVLRPLFERDSLSHGTVNTLNKVATVSISKTMERASGASGRFVTSMDSMNHTFFVTDSGQCGDVTSRHYDDLYYMTERGDYVQFDPEPDSVPIILAP